MVRIPIWFIVLLFGGILALGAICLPLTLFFSWDAIYGDGGFLDQLLNVGAYALMFLLIILPVAALGAFLVWQPERTRYGIFKAVGGLALLYVSFMLGRTVVEEDPPFPTSRQEAANRAAADQ